VKLAIIALILLAVPATLPVRAADPQETLRQAFAAHQAGDMPTAIRLYREFLKDHPEVAEIRSNLGAALARDGQYTAAIVEYREALKKLANNPGIRLNIALAYYKIGRLGEAIEELHTRFTKLRVLAISEKGDADYDDLLNHAQRLGAKEK